MDKTDVLVPNDLYLVNEPKSTEIVPQLFLSHILVETSEIHIPAGIALADSQSNLGRHGRGLSPADFELLSMQGQLLYRGIGVEGSSYGTIQERQKDARLLGEDTDRFEWSKMYEIEKFVNGSGRREVTDVNSASSGISRSRKCCSQSSG